MDDLVMTPTDRARLLAIEAGLLDPAVDGLGLAAMTPEARSEAARKSWLTRKRNQAKPGGEPQSHPQGDQPSTQTQPGTPSDPRAKMSAAIGDGVTKCFNYGKMHGKEAAIAIDADGNKIGNVTGGKASATINSLLTGKETGGVLIHNHPNGSSFSGGDIAVLMHTEFATFVVVDSGGTLYTMSKPAGWTMAKATAGKMEFGYNPSVNLIKAHYKHKQVEALLEIEESSKYPKSDEWEEACHLATERVCTSLGLTYQRQKTGPTA